MIPRWGQGARSVAGGGGEPLFMALQGAGQQDTNGDFNAWLCLQTEKQGPA